MSMTVEQALKRVANLVLTNGESFEDAQAWDILRSHIEREVDEAMVWRACEAYEHSDRTVSGTQHIEASELGMKAALIAALEVGE